ncbi:MAG: glycosyltransferase family 4 protein [Actinomycetales bacterium]|nr:glycosyltransferase family 4 protein [Actinomycetales bacterium]
MSSIIVTHPSADQYGSDLQLLETVSAFTQAGHTVSVLLPASGPLVPMLESRGAAVRFVDVPILRKNLLSPTGLIKLAWSTLRTAPSMWRELRSDRATTALWINTITTPSWFVLGRLAGLRTITHGHEAESDGPKWARLGLAMPTTLAHRIVTNSSAAATALTDLLPRLGKKISVVHNGMPGPTTPPEAPRQRQAHDRATVALIARLSPRKGIDVALEAAAELRIQGIDIRLIVCGTVFEGYEWYETELRNRSQQADLSGAIEFRGYVNPTWPVLAGADVVIVPSRVEPFGNTAVEAFLAERPLVASRTQGLREIVTHELTGLLVEPDNAPALASAIVRLLDDPALAATLAQAGRREALDRFSPEAYRSALVRVLNR